MNLFEISKQMLKTSPVFIVGLPRCGTSILFRTLQRHPTFRPVSLNLWETKIFSFANRSYIFGKEGRPKSQLLHYMMLDEVKYNEFLNSIQLIQAFQRIVNIKGINWVMNQVKWAKTLWWLINQNNLVFRGFFYHAQRARKCGRIVEKSPEGFRHIPQIMLTFPGAMLLCIYRHPVDVYSSYRKRLEKESKLLKDKQKLKWLNISPREFCEQYRKSIDELFDYTKKYGDSILFVKYETFVEDPTKEFRRICEFLEEPFEESAIKVESDLSEMPHDIEPNIFGLIVSKTKDWRKYINIEEAEYIDKELRQTMRILGYQKE